MVFLARENNIGTNGVIIHKEEQKNSNNKRYLMKKSLSRKAKIIQALHSCIKSNEFIS